jgi:hypothetical protein
MTDLKQAYSSTITSSMGDVPQYKSLKEYENIRKAQNVSALSERESMSILKKQEDAILQQSREMAYQLSKEQERVRDRMQQFNSNILLLETGRQSGGR